MLKMLGLLLGYMSRNKCLYISTRVNRRTISDHWLFLGGALFIPPTLLKFDNNVRQALHIHARQDTHVGSHDNLTLFTNCSLNIDPDPAHTHRNIYTTKCTPLS